MVCAYRTTTYLKGTKNYYNNKQYCWEKPNTFIEGEEGFF